MNLGNVKLRPKSYVNGSAEKQESQQISICQCILSLQGTTSPRERGGFLRQIISLCESNWTNQFFLCNNLKVPFRDGPLSLTKVPVGFRQRSNQLLTLFKYLQKIKQSYLCWIIYLDADLGVLNLKLLTKFELSDAYPLFEEQDIIVGIFIGRQYYSKMRTISTKSTTNFHSQVGLSSKTTKDSLKKHSKSKSSKNMKSVSVKEKKPTQADLCLKTLDMSHKSGTKGQAAKNNESCSSLKSSAKLLSKNMKTTEFTVNKTWYKIC